MVVWQLLDQARAAARAIPALDIFDRALLDSEQRGRVVAHDLPEHRRDISSVRDLAFREPALGRVLRKRLDPARPLLGVFTPQITRCLTRALQPGQLASRDDCTKGAE